MPPQAKCLVRFTAPLKSRGEGQKAGGEKAGGERAGGERAGGEKAGGEKAPRRHFWIEKKKEIKSYIRVC